MFFNISPETLDNILNYSLIGAIFGVIKAALSNYRRRLIRYVLTAAISVPVAVIAGFIAQDFFSSSQGVVFAITAVSALLAENLIVAILVWGDSLERNPKQAIKDLKNMFNKQEKDDAK
jgi:ABC-type antimicrobial peptide transport system permease subunit